MPMFERKNSRYSTHLYLKQLGFTIVELITVVILLGILSAVAFARMGSSSAFEPAMLMQQIDEELRLAQKLATSRQDSQISFTLSLNGDQWQCQTGSSVDGILRTALIDRNNSSIVATSSTESVALSTTTTLSLQMDGIGNLTTATLGANSASVDMGIHLLIGGDSQRNLCIYPTGYVAHAACS